MAKKELGYVELQWTCPNCATKNPGSTKTCQGCGAPQPADVQFELKKDAQLLTDEQKINAAKKGPDIHCPFCGTRNPGDAVTCSQCGGDLKTGLHRESGQVVGAYQVQPAPVQEIACPNCATPNPETNSTCKACGAILQPVTPASQAAPGSGAAPAAKPQSKLVIIIIISLAILCIIIGLVYLLSTAARQTSTIGTVANVAWVRQIAIMELGPVTRQAWKENIPDKAKVGECELKFHHEQQETTVNATEVCGTPYSKETGSGFAEVVQDCKYLAYRDYCSYTIDEWHVITTLKTQGDDLNPAWPSLNLANNQRTGDQSETYRIIFQTDQNTYTYTTSDAELFNQFQPGSQWELTINGFGDIVDIQPK